MGRVSGSGRLGGVLGLRYAGRSVGLMIARRFSAWGSLLGPAARSISPSIPFIPKGFLILLCNLFFYTF